MNDEECITKYGTYYICYKQYRKILEQARSNYMKKNWMIPPRDFVIPTDEIKLTMFVDKDLYRYITALTLCIHKLSGDDLFKESVGSLIDLNEKLIDVWSYGEGYGEKYEEKSD